MSWTIKCATTDMLRDATAVTARWPVTIVLVGRNTVEIAGKPLDVIAALLYMHKGDADAVSDILEANDIPVGRD